MKNMDSKYFQKVKGFDYHFLVLANNVISIEASCPEITRINNTIIESVKFEFLKYLTKKELPDTINKNLFTMDEYYDTLSENKVKSNTFHIPH